MKFALIALLVSAALASGDPIGGESLFNGKDLTGWKVPKNNIWWKVEGGTLVVQSGPKKKGSILWTEKTYRDFDFEGEFKFDGKGDSGVFLRNDKQQIQIGISGSLKRDMTGSPYIPGKGYPVEAEEEKGTKGVKNLLKIDDWNTLKIRAVGAQYDVWLNGKAILSYQSEKVPEEGPIGLQLHGNKVMRIDFRNMKVQEIVRK